MCSDLAVRRFMQFVLPILYPDEKGMFKQWRGSAMAFLPEKSVYQKSSIETNVFCQRLYWIDLLYGV